MSNLGLYRGITPRLDQAIEWLASLDPDSVKPGRVEIDGERLFMLCQEYETRPIDEGRWETHRRYLDIQSVVEGTETILYNTPDNLRESEPYDPETDKTRYVGDGMPVTVRAGSFLIAFPNDAHKACVYASEGPHRVKKIVIKVLL